MTKDRRILAMIRGALLYVVVWAVFPSWPQWRIFIVGVLIGSLIVVSNVLQDTE
jgi:hypothetical protein